MARVAKAIAWLMSSKLSHSGENIFSNAVWYAYIIPAILLGYAYGFRGGIFNARLVLFWH